MTKQRAAGRRHHNEAETSLNSSSAAIIPTEVVTREELSPMEEEELAECEEAIRKHEGSFIKYALALFTIRDSRLYRAKYDSFEEYCRKNLGRSRQYASRIAQAGEVISSLPGDLRLLVPNENCARALHSVNSEMRSEVLEQLKARKRTGPVTGPMIRRTARTIPGALRPEAVRARGSNRRGGGEMGKVPKEAIAAVIRKTLARLAGRLTPKLGDKTDRIGSDERNKHRGSLEKAVSAMKAHEYTTQQERRILLEGVQWLASKYLRGNEREMVMAATVD